MRIVLPVSAIVLIAAIGLVSFGAFRVPDAGFRRSLLELLPDGPDVGAWRRTLQPIADTPEMKEAVGELLSYDDGVFAVYNNGAQRISVYLAYWTPGKMSHRLVAVHTPDVCWVGGGWKRVSGDVWRGKEPSTKSGEFGPRVGGGGQNTAGQSFRVQPGERRTFVMTGQTEHVVFWHLVGGKAKSYGTGYAPPWWSPLVDLWERGLNQREEQYFVRISSNEPIEAIWDTPVVQHVITRVPELLILNARPEI